jgi:uncharacterized protein YodC (DUF2158 family)
MTSFKPGDLVQLKSGGPVMTVNAIMSVERLQCTWFGGKKLESGVFHVEALQAATNTEK